MIYELRSSMDDFNKLKEGDAVLVRCRYVCVKENGDVRVSYPVTTRHGKLYFQPASVHPHAVVLQESDPCRLFKAGDEVRVVDRDGREMPFCNYINPGEVYTVARDEKDGVVALFTCDGIDCTSWYWLELVTPVEEKTRYNIKESEDGATKVLTVFSRGCKQGIEFRYCPGWGGNVFLSETQWRQHAEAECARLNKEWQTKVCRSEEGKGGCDESDC